MSFDLLAVSEGAVAFASSMLALSSDDEARRIAESLRSRRVEVVTILCGALQRRSSWPAQEAEQAQAWRAVWDAIPLKFKAAGMRMGEAPIETALRFVRQGGD